MLKMEDMLLSPGLEALVRRLSVGGTCAVDPLPMPVLIVFQGHGSQSAGPTHGERKPGPARAVGLVGSQSVERLACQNSPFG
jgi:hypothetical protein